MLRHRRLKLVAIAAVGLALTACSGGDVEYTGPSIAPPAAPAPTPGGSAPGTGVPQASATPAPPAEVALTAREAAGLGQVVTDAAGFTLYRFENDTAKPPTSTCLADCATKWPPLVVDRNGKLTLEGVEQSAVGLVERPDGTTQLTLGGWPMYRFTGDETPGSAEGQGVGGTWFAITPGGAKATAAP